MESALDESSKSPEGRNVKQRVKGVCVFRKIVRAMNYCTGEMDIAAICFNCESDGCKWEWGNCYENDGTPDNSIWTSIETDGILETSPSVNQNFDESTYNE